MTIEKGCLIFSIINVVFCSLWVYTSVDSLTILDRAIELTPAPNPEEIGFINQTLLGAAWISLASATVAVIFAVFLCIGVIKKNPSYILAYLRYGIVTEVLYVLGTVGFIGFAWERPEFNTYIIYSAIYFGTLLIYLLPLVLVYKTYVLITERKTFSLSGASQFTPKPHRHKKRR